MLIDKTSYLSGRHQVEFDTRELPSGIYFCRMTTSEEGGQTTSKRRMLVIR